MIFATFFFDGTLQAFPTYPHATIKLVRTAMEHIRNRSVLLGWIQFGVAWRHTRETKAYNNVFVALLHSAETRAGTQCHHCPPRLWRPVFATGTQWSVILIDEFLVG